MSLLNQALVYITHYTLEGRTWADTNIKDQPIDPIGDLLQGADDRQKPVLAVYVESARAQVHDRATQGQKTTVNLKVFVYISPKKMDLPEDVEFELDGTTAGLSLNLLGRQVDAALHYGNDEWIRVWRKFILNITERRVQYILVEIEDNVRIPAMEITYECEAIPDPEYGVQIENLKAWSMLDTALRADGGDKLVLADLFKSMIESPADLARWEQLGINFGLTEAGLDATGLGPFERQAVDDETHEPAPLSEVRVDWTQAGGEPSN